MAVEPLPLTGEELNNGTLPPDEGIEEQRVAEGGETTEQKQDTATPQAEQEAPELETPRPESEAETPVEEPKEQAKEQEQTNEERTKKTKEEAKQGGPLEAVLHMQPPEVVAKQHPAMSPPPYVHHFDSYGLVKQLQDGGYSQPQATTAMKGIRTLLAQNLDVAQSSLVSKSDVENVSLIPTSISNFGY